MTIQKAAYEILEKHQSPMKSIDIAREALSQGMVHSKSKDPHYSLSQTIEKNIRNKVYNDPKLKFVQQGNERLIGISSKEYQPTEKDPCQQTTKEVSLRLPIDMYDIIQLAAISNFESDFDQTIKAILRKGLSIIANDVKVALTKRINKFDSN